jgi:hypothetical protein
MNNKVWSDEEEQELIKLYRDDKMDVSYIAEYFGKNNRSIVSKLVRLKIYIKPNANKSTKRSVKSMITDIEKMLDIELEGVNLSKRSNLEVLTNAIKLRFDQNTDLK